MHVLIEVEPEIIKDADQNGFALNLILKSTNGKLKLEYQ